MYVINNTEISLTIKFQIYFFPDVALKDVVSCWTWTGASTPSGTCFRSTCTPAAWVSQSAWWSWPSKTINMLANSGPSRLMTSSGQSRPRTSSTERPGHSPLVIGWQRSTGTRFSFTFRPSLSKYFSLSLQMKWNIFELYYSSLFLTEALKRKPTSINVTWKLWLSGLSLRLQSVRAACPERSTATSRCSTRSVGKQPLNTGRDSTTEPP